MVKKSSVVLVLVFAVIFSILFCTWGIVRIGKFVSFKFECTQYLKRAADANSIELAKGELNKAISYAESHDLTEGIVSILFHQPKNDVGYWYNNLKTAYAELEELPDDVTPLERTNVLMKLRETLTDQQDDGIEVTVPNGISIYPHNRLYLAWGVVSFILTVVFWCLFAHLNYYGD